MFTLERYSGKESRHTCPACGANKRFTRYVNTETGEYLAEDVGRCDRESNCGYHKKPSEHFAEDRAFKPSFRSKASWQTKRPFDALNAKQTPRIGYLERHLLTETLADYERNDFVQFLLDLFDPEAVQQTVREYLIGTGKGGEAIFWQVDRTKRIRTGKVIRYDRKTGKRDKDFHPSWMHPKEGFSLRQCFYGEHLLAERPGLPIAIVESEKSAIVASVFKSVFPDLVWLATGGKSNLNADRLQDLPKDRKIILYPDADGFERWSGIAFETRRAGRDITVSDLIERNASDAERQDGCDLADYLIREQRTALQDFEELIQERLAIMIFDGNLTEEEAQAEIIASGFYHNAIKQNLRLIARS